MYRKSETQSRVITMSVASIALAIWLYLLFARGAFWLNSERDEPAPPMPASWPRVVAVVPARNAPEPARR